LQVIKLTSSREYLQTSNQAALADMEEGFAEPEAADKKPKVSPESRGSHPIVGHKRLAGSAGRPAPAHNVSAATNNAGRPTAMSRSGNSAYAWRWPPGLAAFQ